MDSIEFYVPPSVPARQPRSSGGCAAFLPAVAPFPSSTITSNSTRQTTAQRIYRNETRKDFDIVRCVDVSDPVLPRHLSKQRTSKGDLVQVQENSSLNEDGENDDFPTIEQLVSNRRQDSISGSTKPSAANMCQDALTIMQQSNPTHTENIAREANSRTRDSPADSSHSTSGTTQDPIILSNDESESAESGTDYSDLDFDLNLNLNLTATDDSRSLHNPYSWLADDDDFDTGTTFNSSHLVAECHNNNSNNGDGIINTATRLRSASRPRPTSPCSSAATYQTSKLQLDTEGTKRRADHVDTGVFGQLEGDALDVFAEEDKWDSDNAHSTKRRKLMTISLHDPTA